MSIRLGCLLILILAAQAAIFPPAVEEIYSEGFLELSHVCNLFQHPSTLDAINTQYYLRKVLKRVNGNTDCHRPLTFNKDVHTSLTATPGFHLKPEAYEIRVSADGVAISFGDYSGYVYALESLSQIIKKNRIPFVTVRDAPLLEYRGIMIDSARHFLGVAAIKRLI